MVHISELVARDDDSALEAVLIYLKQHAHSTEAGEQKSTAVYSYVNAEDPDDQRTAFHWALTMKNFALAEKLRGEPYHCSVATADEGGVTPLMTACSVGAPASLVAHLLSAVEPERRREFVNSQDEGGNTAVTVAASKGDAELLSMLLDAGGNGGHKNQRGQTPVHRAVGKGSVECTELLVNAMKKSLGSETAEFKKWIDAQDVGGNTALHYAGMESNQDVGQVLLRAGARRDVKNSDGKEFWEC